MKYLNWFKDNLNLISTFAGLVLVITGRDDIGRILITHGGG